MRIAVIDSSFLINLSHLGLAEQLALFFDLVYVPRAVQREVNRKGRFRYRLNRLYRNGFFQRCRAADATNVRLLMDSLDEGEAEAFIQAQEKDAQFFLGDETRARVLAHAMGRKAVGTVRVLARLHLQGQASDTSTLVRRLRHEVGFHVAEDVVAQAIAKSFEPI